MSQPTTSHTYFKLSNKIYRYRAAVGRPFKFCLNYLAAIQQVIANTKKPKARGGLVAKLTWVVICFGIIVRIHQFLFNRSLAYDEALLALNIIEKPFLELLKPLDYRQAAPIGFLLLQRLMVQTLGDGEYVLRFIPLVAGVLSMILFYQVAKKCLDSTGLIIGLGLFALSDPLISYSSESKQYSSDVVIGLFLSLLGISYLERGALKARNIAVLSIFGAIALLVSHPSAFVLTAVGTTLMLAGLLDRKWEKASQLSAICLLWLLGFACLYFISLRSLAKDEFFALGWWKLGAFMPLIPSSVTDLRWFASNFFEMFRNPVGIEFAGLAALAFVTGCVTFFADKKRILLILIAPLLFSLLASALHKYPFRGRFLLFVVPAIIIIIAKGTEVILEKTWGSAKIIGIATTSLLFFHPLFYATQYLQTPRTVEEIKPVMRHIEEHKQGGDSIYVFHGALPMFRYYERKYGFADGDYIVGVESTVDYRNYISDVERLLGHKRVWFVFSHSTSQGGMDEKSFFLYYLGNVGKRISAFESIGAAVYLYDLTPSLGTAATWHGLPNVIPVLAETFFPVRISEAEQPSFTSRRRILEVDCVNFAGLSPTLHSIQIQK